MNKHKSQKKLALNKETLARVSAGKGEYETHPITQFSACMCSDACSLYMTMCWTCQVP